MQRPNSLNAWQPRLPICTHATRTAASLRLPRQVAHAHSLLVNGVCRSDWVCPPKSVLPTSRCALGVTWASSQRRFSTIRETRMISMARKPTGTRSGRRSAVAWHSHSQASCGRRSFTERGDSLIHLLRHRQLRRPLHHRRREHPCHRDGTTCPRPGRMGACTTRSHGSRSTLRCPLRCLS